jgi:hypothetical protein
LRNLLFGIFSQFESVAKCFIHKSIPITEEDFLCGFIGSLEHRRDTKYFPVGVREIFACLIVPTGSLEISILIPFIFGIDRVQLSCIACGT